MKLTIYGNPVTKKNSQRILYKFTKFGRKTPFIAPSKAYVDYETAFGKSKGRPAPFLPA